MKFPPFAGAYWGIGRRVLGIGMRYYSITLLAVGLLSTLGSLSFGA